MLTIGTRFFGKDTAKDLPRLSAFISAGEKLGKVFVAVNTSEDKCDTITYCNKNHPHADVFAVTPWQKFVAPLNAIVYRAALFGANQLLLASAEFAPERDQVDALLSHLNEDTLVAGARFSEHPWQGGELEGTGLTVPWNTFALWNTRYLSIYGFPLIGDGPFNQEKSGVEEVATIALYQKLFGVSAKLVSVPGFYEEWNMDGWDEERKKKHEAKMASKIMRPAAQLALAGLSAPRILQIG